MTIFYVALAVLMFGIMITVHELGHFVAARLTRIPVRAFAVGFGPALVKWTSKKHETEFAIRAIPMGGYCAFYGEDDIDGKYKDDPRNFGIHAVWRRFITVLMGAVMNLVLAFLVASLFYALSGVPRITGPYTTRIMSVGQGSPGELAGMQPGDRIARVNDVAITDNLSHVIATLAEADAFPMKVVVERGEGDALTQHEMMLTPLYDTHEGRYLIGINIQQAAPVTWQRGNPMEVLQAGYRLCVDAGSAILNGLRDLLLRGKGMGDVSGVVGVTQFIVEETRQAKLEGYLYLMSVISINLGLFNLLPIPGLDGSRLLFLVWEGVRGKPVKREAYVHAIGMLFLLGLMIWINFRDILRLFQ